MSPTDAKVIIKNGNLLAGVIDNSVLLDSFPESLMDAVWDQWRDSNHFLKIFENLHCVHVDFMFQIRIRAHVF